MGDKVENRDSQLQVGMGIGRSFGDGLLHGFVFLVWASRHNFEARPGRIFSGSNIMLLFLSLSWIWKTRRDIILVCCSPCVDHDKICHTIRHSYLERVCHKQWHQNFVKKNGLINRHYV